MWSTCPTARAPRRVRACLHAFCMLSIVGLSPTVLVTVFTNHAVPAPIRVWAGDEIQLLLGPVAVPAIPALSEHGTMAWCLLVASAALWSLRR